MFRFLDVSQFTMADLKRANCGLRANLSLIASHSLAYVPPQAQMHAIDSRQVCTHRSMIEFILGIRTPLRTAWMPASARMTSNRLGNFPSRSLIRNRARQPASSKSITRFLAAYAAQDAVG